VPQLKHIEVTFSDHTTWRLDARLVAVTRADYLAAGDAARGEGEYDEVFQRELEIGLSDRIELVDYLENNMEWEDFADTATLVAAPRYGADYAREFSNASKRIEWSDEI
jgi:hypothetical protein